MVEDLHLADIHVRVLPKVDSPQALKKIASRTKTTAKGQITGDPLGYIDGREFGNDLQGRSTRKTSPLKFKVGHFSGGHRLIAIWDNRHARGGDLRAALAALRDREIGKLLSQVHWPHENEETPPH